jgi:hypothetical protein
MLVFTAKMDSRYSYKMLVSICRYIQFYDPEDQHHLTAVRTSHLIHSVFCPAMIFVVIRKKTAQSIYQFDAVQNSCNESDGRA